MLESNAKEISKPSRNKFKTFLHAFKRTIQDNDTETENNPIWKILASFISLFLSVSTIHGFAHVIAKKRHLVEIIIWVSLMGCGAFGAIKLSSATWTRYQENPTVVSMERDRYAWNTSFPAATICPSLKVNEVLLANYLATSKAKDKVALGKFLRTLATATYNTFDKVLPYTDLPSEEFMDVLLQLQQEFTPTVSNSGVNGYTYVLQKVITEMGICYSFTSNLAPYNSPSYWKSNSWSFIPEIPPFFVHPLDGEVFANVVNMSTDFHFYIHGPDEVVDIASKSVYSPDGRFLQVYLSGLAIFTTDSAHALSISQRKCRFYDESDLRHSPVYSYILCRMECRAAWSKRLCNCVPHFYRHLDGEKICDVAGMHCLAKHSEFLITMKKECSCYPNCDDINYVIEHLDSRDWFLGSNLQWGLKAYPRMRLRRDVIFGFTDVLVYVGGMAGLFLGCSVLSFIEIIYFFTIRLFWYVKKYAKNIKRLNSSQQ